MKDDLMDDSPNESGSAKVNRSDDLSADHDLPPEGEDTLPPEIPLSVRSEPPVHAAAGQPTGGPAESDDDDSDDEITQSGEAIDDHTSDDPLSPGFDIDSGESFRSPGQHRNDSYPWRNKLTSAKEFFGSEILYRYDIMEPETQADLTGIYRLELKGNRGGIWTITVGDGVTVVNRSEEADVVLTMQQSDFVHIVNGTLNPQLAILAQKIKVTGDVKKAVAFQCLVSPSVD